MADLKTALSKIAAGSALSQQESYHAFDVIMSGNASPAQLGALLMGLRVRGETVEEITGAVQVMRAKMLKVQAPDHAIDIVGTGGDGSGSYNVSTCAAFVVAGCGIPVAKHGNRAVSSRSGSADVLTALGVNVDVGADVISRCITEAGVGFMFAPVHHTAMRHIGPIRQELGMRTVFNLIGPLSNPAGVKKQVLGVYARQWVEPLAHALRALGTTNAWVVHGSDGLDEITTTGSTCVAELKNGAVRLFDLTPEEAGLSRAKPEDLIGGDSTENAKALQHVLEGQPSAYRDIVVLNAAAALLVSGVVQSLQDGVLHAQKALDNGAALQKLNDLVRISNQ